MLKGKGKYFGDLLSPRRCEQTFQQIQSTKRSVFFLCFGAPTAAVIRRQTESPFRLSFTRKPTKAVMLQVFQSSSSKKSTQQGGESGTGGKVVPLHERNTVGAAYRGGCFGLKQYFSSVVGVLGWGNDSRRRAMIFLIGLTRGPRAVFFFTFSIVLLSLLPTTCGASGARAAKQKACSHACMMCSQHSYPPHPRPHLTLSPIHPTPRFSVCLLPTPPSERFNQLWQGAQRTRCRHQHEQTRKKEKMMTMTMTMIVVVGLMMLSSRTTVSIFLCFRGV